MVLAATAPTFAYASTRAKSRITFLNVIGSDPEAGNPVHVRMTWSIDATTFPNPTVHARLDRWSKTKKRYVGYSGQAVKAYQYDLPVDGVSKKRIATLKTNTRGEFSLKPSAAGEYLATYGGNSSTKASSNLLDRFDDLEGMVKTTVSTSSVDASTTRVDFDAAARYNPNYRQGGFIAGVRIPWDSPTIQVEPSVHGRESSSMGVFTGRALSGHVDGQARFTFSTLVPAEWLFDQSTGASLEIVYDTIVLFPNPYVHVRWVQPQ